MTRFRLILALGTALSFAASVCAPASASIYNTLGGTENGGDPLAAAGPVLADVIVPATSTLVRSVTLKLALGDGPLGSFAVALQQIVPGYMIGDSALSGTGPVTTFATVQDTSLTASFALYTFVLGTPVWLTADTPYAIGVVDTGNSAAILGNTLTPFVLNRPAVVAGAVYYNNGGVQANAGAPYELSVDAVPEPATFAMFGLGAVALLRARRARG